MKTIKVEGSYHPEHDQCRSASLIYENAHYSASSLLRAFDLLRKVRKGGGATARKPRGMTTDEEQDILRAMLVMAAAGLDSCLKQLIRDTLPHLAERDIKVQQGFEKFIRQSLSGGEMDSDATNGVKFLARVLATRSPYGRAIDEYVRDLTGDSLQSADQVLSAVAALGLDNRRLSIDPDLLREVFGVRNKIIHEFDVDLAGERRKRNLRSLPDMVKYTDAVLATAHAILEAVDGKM